MAASDSDGTQATVQDQPPTVFVLFGATGDLAKRMVLPAFFTLAAKGLLPKEYLLVGNGRGDVSHEDFKGHVHDVLTEFGPHPDEGPWDDFSSRLRFAGGGFDADATAKYPWEIARDVGLLLLSLWLVWKPRTRFALDSLLFRRPTPAPERSDHAERPTTVHG